MHSFFLLILFSLLLEFFLIVYYGWRMLRPWRRSVAWGYLAVTGSISLLFFLQFFLLRPGTVPMAVGRPLYLWANGWLAFAFYTLVWIALTELSLLALSGVESIRSRRKQIRRKAFAVSLLLTTGLLIYGNRQLRNPVSERLPIKLEKPLSPTRAVAISDLHLGYGTDRQMLAELVDRILLEKPDLIVLAGDLIDNSVPVLRIDSMQGELRRLQAPLGVFMVPGNHEYISGIDASRRLIGETPIVWLQDSVVVLPNGLQLIGRDDRFNPNRKPLGELTARCDPNRPILLLDHQPTDPEANARAGIDLQFSGHTHRGQMFPFSLLADFHFPVSYGYKRLDSMQLYVTSGLSLWGPPFRIGTQSELAVLELEGTETPQNSLR